MHFAFGLDRFDPKDVLGPLIEQAHQLAIDVVDVLADLLKFDFFIFHAQTLSVLFTSPTSDTNELEPTHE